MPAVLTAQGTPADPTPLGFGSVLWVVLIIAVAVVAVGFVIWAARSWLSRRSAGDSLVRSWLAVSLILGLLVFCAASFALDDPTLRNTLFGGLIASSAAATAFYFASKNADQARKDILDASFGTVTVPPLEGKSIAEVHEILARTALELHVDPLDASESDTVAHQTPPASTTVRKGSVVTVTAAPQKGGPPKTTPDHGRSTGAASADSPGATAAVPTPASDGQVTEQAPDRTPPRGAPAQRQASDLPSTEGSDSEQRKTDAELPTAG